VKLCSDKNSTDKRFLAGTFVFHCLLLNNSFQYFCISQPQLKDNTVFIKPTHKKMGKLATEEIHGNMYIFAKK